MWTRKFPQQGQRLVIEEKPKKSAKRQKPLTPPLEDVQALVDMLTGHEESRAEKHCDVNAVISWLREASGYGDLLKVDTADDDAAVVESAPAANPEISTAADEPETPRPRNTPRQGSTRRDRIQPRPV